MKTAFITSYWQKTYATWDQKKFRWSKEIKKPVEKKELKIEYSSAIPGMEEIKILGGPIKDKIFLITHLFKPSSGEFLLSPGVVNKFPEVWIKWEDLEKVLERFKNGS